MFAYLASLFYSCVHGRLLGEALKEHLVASLSTVLALYSPIKVCQVNGYEDMLRLNVVCGGGCFIASSGWKLVSIGYYVEYW